jgi:hypothetical protein
MAAIDIREGASPADLVGETDLLPGQNWLVKDTLLQYARQMQQDIYPWGQEHQRQPMAVEVGTNGKVISQGHHRFIAARLAGVEIPYVIDYRYDYLEANLPVPFARAWIEVAWKLKP